MHGQQNIKNKLVVLMLVSLFNLLAESVGCIAAVIFEFVCFIH